MRREDLEAKVFTEVIVPPDLWAAARLLARARSDSNTARRSEHDRGDKGNTDVDLHGAFGELLLQRTLRQIADSDDAQRYMSESMFVAQGGSGLGNHPDLQFEEAGSTFGVDAKTFDCRENKRYFAIADSKHVGLRGMAQAYFAAIAPPYGRRVILSKLVPYHDVDAWEIGQLRPGGNPSRNLPIGEFLTRYCPPNVELGALRSDVYESREVEELAASMKLKNYLVKLIPAIDGFV
jgi:hypothetical protein